MPEVLADDGITIHYDAFGRRDGPPLLMLQGLGTDARGWALQRLVFGRQYRCLAPDNRGVGRTGPVAGPYSLDQMASDALSVLDAEGIESAHVIGASMGGIIAQILAVMSPDRVRGLVLACTACRHHEWRRELLAEWAAAVETEGIGVLGDEALEWLIGPRLRKRFGIWLNLGARIVVQQDPDAFVWQIHAILDAPDALRHELVHLAAPTLVITGSQDSLTPVGDAEELAELIPQSRLEVVGGAAHGLMLEAPIAFNQAVLGFLAGVDDMESAAADCHRAASA